MATTRLTRIDPFQAAKAFAALYAILSLVFVPFLILAALLGRTQFGVGLALMFPVIYGVAAFIGVMVALTIFNFVCGKLGGIEVTFQPIESFPAHSSPGPAPRPPIVPGA